MNTIDWLKKLISFDTTSRNSNLELIHYLQAYLTDLGIESLFIKHPEQPKANLLATLPAANGNKTGGIILSGHTDVVPIDGQIWETDPFVATIKDNKIFGRGAADMKGFIAVVLALLPTALKIKLKQPIHLAFSYDEEIGCLGAPYIIKEIQALNIKPFACIVGEPTDMKPVVAHKGKLSYRCIVSGKAAHSSLTTKGCNAIEYAARLICFIRELAESYKKEGAHDQYYDVPFTTLTTNLIHGGNAQNTIPAYCEFLFEYRNLPEDKPELIRESINLFIENELLPQMRKEDSAATITLEPLAGAPSLSVSENAEIVSLTRSITGINEPVKVSYGTEAGLFQEAEIPTIICGPGSIQHAHGPNEFITIDQLNQCENFLRELINKIS